MTNITEHDTEQERECHNCEQTWVDFFITRHTVGIDDQLEDRLEFVQLEVSRRHQVAHRNDFQSAARQVSVLHAKLLQGFFSFADILLGNPSVT